MHVVNLQPKDNGSRPHFAHSTSLSAPRDKPAFFVGFAFGLKDIYYGSTNMSTQERGLSYSQITEFASSGLTTVRYIIDGPIEDVPIMFHQLAAIFPNLAGRYNLAVISGLSRRGVSKDEKMGEVRKLLSLALSDRVASIPKDEKLYVSTQFVARLAGYPEVAVGWGNRVQDGVEVVTLFVLKGASPREEFAKLKDRIRLALTKRN